MGECAFLGFKVTSVVKLWSDSHVVSSWHAEISLSTEHCDTVLTMKFPVTIILPDRYFNNTRHVFKVRSGEPLKITHKR